MERTLSIIKPDGVKRNLIGKIVDKFEAKDLKIAGMKMKTLSLQEAQDFYAVHKERPFFGELVDYMVSGPVVVMVLEGAGAIDKNREIMGATNPKDAVAGTIRAEWGIDVGTNTVHGSDAPETAKEEIKYFFKDGELI